jgi:hypothetical protein
VQNSREQRASTTANVNLYTCRSLLPGAAVQFLDFEGENGSEAPVALGGGACGGSAPPCSLVTSVLRLGAAGGAAVAAGAGGAPPPPPPPPGGGITRHEAVRDVFPKLAYTTSDIVTMVGTEPFFSKRYLERVVSFAARANVGVGDADLPVLLLLCNRRDPEACVLDFQASTAQFAEAMGDAGTVLDQYFSSVLCIYLPNKRARVETEGGEVFDGAALYAQQMGLLRQLLAELMKSRLLTRYGGAGGGGAGGGGSAGRFITDRQGLWYELLPRVVREINAGRSVAVMRLVDEAWAAAMGKGGGGGGGGGGSAACAEGDALKVLAVWAKPPPYAPAVGAAAFLARFDAYVAFAADLAVRAAAAALRGVAPELRLPQKVRAYALAQLRTMLELLEAQAPCRASVSGELGAPVGAPPGEPVACLQERRAHAKGHRAACLVRGGGRTLWQRAVNALAAHTPVWAGRHEAPLVHAPDEEALAAAAGVLADAPQREWLRAVAALQKRHGASAPPLLLVALPCGAAPAGAAPASAAPASAAPACAPFPLRLSPTPEGAVAPPFCVGCMRPQAGGGAAAARDGGGGADAHAALGGLVVFFSSALGLAGECAAAPAAPAHEAPRVLGLCGACCASARALGLLP